MNRLICLPEPGAIEVGLVGHFLALYVE